MSAKANSKRSRPVVPAWKEVGDRIRAALDRSDFGTQAALSEATGIDKATMSNVLNGKVQATTDNLRAIGKALGIDPAAFLSDTHKNEQDVATQVLPEGLPEFLGLNTKRLAITKEDVDELIDERFETPPWTQRDATFWEQALKYIRSKRSKAAGKGGDAA